MDWRPFSQAFVPNTFAEFLSKHDISLPFQKKLNIINGLPVFRFKPSADDVESEKEKFTKLRRKVYFQRRMIRSRDTESLERQKKSMESDRSKAGGVREERLRNAQQVRELARNSKQVATHVRTRSTRSCQEGESSGDESRFFSLTSAVDVTGKAFDLPKLARPNAAKIRKASLGDDELQDRRKHFRRTLDQSPNKDISNF